MAGVLGVGVDAQHLRWRQVQWLPAQHDLEGAAFVIVWRWDGQPSEVDVRGVEPPRPRADGVPQLGGGPPRVEDADQPPIDGSGAGPVPSLRDGAGAVGPALEVQGLDVAQNQQVVEREPAGMRCVQQPGVLIVPERLPVERSRVRKAVRPGWRERRGQLVVDEGRGDVHRLGLAPAGRRREAGVGDRWLRRCRARQQADSDHGGRRKAPQGKSDRRPRTTPARSVDDHDRVRHRLKQLERRTRPCAVSVIGFLVPTPPWRPGSAESVMREYMPSTGFRPTAVAPPADGPGTEQPASDRVQS